jgi:hypothetical protein
MSDLFISKNDKQAYFNQIKGEVLELNKTDGSYHNITLKVGHEKPRSVNLMIHKDEYVRLIEAQDVKLGERICAKFYLKSRKRENGYWFTIACILDVEKVG